MSRGESEGKREKGDVPENNPISHELTYHQGDGAVFHEESAPMAQTSPTRPHLPHWRSHFHMRFEDTYPNRITDMYFSQLWRLGSSSSSSSSSSDGYLCICNEGYEGPNCEQALPSLPATGWTESMAPRQLQPVPPTQEPDKILPHSQATVTLPTWQPKTGQKVVEMKWDQVEVRTFYRVHFYIRNQKS